MEFLGGERMLYRNRKQKLTLIIVVTLLILLISLIGFAVHLIQKYTPTKDRMDPVAYYGISDAQELPLIFGTEVLQMSGKLLDGAAYVPLEAVDSYLNHRFYWDPNENILIYTTPTEKLIITPETDSYMIGEQRMTADGIICKVMEEIPYIHIAFVKQVTDIEYTLLQQPSRLVVQYQWSGVPVVEVKEDTQVRYQGGIKSEILTVFLTRVIISDF